MDKKRAGVSIAEIRFESANSGPNRIVDMGAVSAISVLSMSDVPMENGVMVFAKNWSLSLVS